MNLNDLHCLIEIAGDKFAPKKLRLKAYAELLQPTPITLLSLDEKKFYTLGAVALLCEAVAELLPEQEEC